MSERQITRITPVVLVSLVVEQTPHPSLSVNDKTDERKKTRHKDALRWAAASALQNALVADSGLSDRLARHSFRLDFTFEWEQYRRRCDDDNLTGGPCKVIRDAIATKLDRDDADWETGSVEQIFGEERHGCVIVDLVAIGEIEAVPIATSDELGPCLALTTRGFPCHRPSVFAVSTAEGVTVVFCQMHSTVLNRRGGLSLADGGCVAIVNDDAHYYPDARVGVVAETSK